MVSRLTFATSQEPSFCDRLYRRSMLLRQRCGLMRLSETGPDAAGRGGYLGGGMAELLLQMALVDLGRGGEAGRR